MSAKRGVKMHLLRILRDTGGNVMPMAAVGMLVMAALVGGGVDMSHAYRVQSRLQAACDAGVLAARKTVNVEQNGYSSRVERTARDYFEANFDKNQQAVRDEPVFTPSSPDGGDTIKGTASATVDTAIMRIFGFNTMPVSVDCTASMGVGNSDITMVLDVTGSMAWTAAGYTPRSGQTSRIQDLQAAMRTFYTTVKTSADRSGARIRYAFVPYSSSVNVGRLLMAKKTDYIVDSYRIQSRQWVDWNDPVVTTSPTSTTANYSTASGSQYGSTSYSSSSSCTSALPANTSWQNNGSATTSTSKSINSSGQKIEQITSTQEQIRTGYYCQKSGNGNNSKYYRYSRYEYQDIITSYVQTSTAREWLTNSTNAAAADDLVYRQVQYDVRSYKNFNAVQTLTGSSSGRPAWQTSAVWAGCIEERATVSDQDFTYADNVISPEEALDLDIDLEPDSDDATKWAPMWPELAYIRKNSNTNNGRIISDNYSFYGALVGSSCPVQSQLLTEMTQTQFNAYAASLSPDGATYHDIGILWGARLSSPTGIFADNVNARPSNGGAVSRHMIFMTDGEMDPNNQIQSSYGIEWHDRRVTDDGSSNDDSRHTSRFLALCEAVRGRGIRLWVVAFGTGLTDDLRECASPESSFSASSASELNAAFQTIGTQVGELRITQ